MIRFFTLGFRRGRHSMLLMIWGGCAASIAPAPEPEVLETVTSTEPVAENGVWSIWVDATDYEEWVPFGFADNSILQVDDLPSSEVWDLALRRFEIMSNGGVSGPGSWEVSWVEGRTIEDPGEPPKTGWITDSADDDDDGLPELAFEEWYDYDYQTHILTPKSRLYFLRNAEDAVVALQMDSYYNDVGTPAKVNFRWQLLSGELGEPSGDVPIDTDTTDSTDTDEPAGDTDTMDTGLGVGVIIAEIDASSYDDWVYYSFEEADLVAPENPVSSTGWDLGLKRYEVKVNGGISGFGGMVVAIVEETPFVDVVEVPEPPYLSDLPDDDEDGSPEYALATWYDYNYQTHVLTPADRIYVIQTTTGDWVKVQFLDYYSAGVSGHPSFKWAYLDAP